ncbi:hypothetical protein LINPERPRIM_LOCUS31566 [Linum perenne]
MVDTLLMGLDEF